MKLKRHQGGDWGPYPLSGAAAERDQVAVGGAGGQAGGRRQDAGGGLRRGGRVHRRRRGRGRVGGPSCCKTFGVIFSCNSDITNYLVKL